MLVLHDLILSDGIVGFRSDWVFPISTSQSTSQALSNLYVYHDNLGQVANAYYINEFIIALLSIIFNVSLALKIILFFSLSMSGLFLYYLCRTLKICHISSVIAGFFYMTTPVIFNQFRIGHFAYIIDYAIAPLIIALFIKIISRKDTNLNLVFISALIYALLWAQFQFLFMIFLILLFCSIFFSPKNLKIRSLSLLLLISSGSIIIHLFWILPQLFSSTVDTGTLATKGYLEHTSLNLLDILRLIAYEGVPSTFGETIKSGMVVSLSMWNIISFIIPIVVFSTIIFLKDKRALCFIILILLTIFVAKGVNPPFGCFYFWLYDNIPIFAIFRHLSHLMFIMSLSYAILIGLIFQELMEATYSKLEFLPRLEYYGTVVNGCVIFLFIVLCVHSWPLFTGDFNGTVQTYLPKAAYDDTYEYLSKLDGAFKVAWLPISSALFYNDSKFFDTTRDPMIVYSPKSSIDADTRTYHRFYAFIHRVIENERTNNLADLLGISGVKYVISREDVRSRYSNNWNQTVFLEDQEDIELVETYGDVKIFRNKRYRPIIYPTKTSMLVGGDFSAMISLSSFYKFKKEMFPTLFFPSQQSSANFESLLLLTNYVLISDYNDYLFSFLPDNFKFSPARFVNGWWPYLSWSPYYCNWGIDQEEVNSMNDGVITLVSDSFNISFFAQEEEYYDIWLKTYIGEKGSRLSFLMDDDNFTSLSTYDTYKDGLYWSKIGILRLDKGIHNLEIISDKGMNIVDMIVIIPSGVFYETIQIANKTLENKNILIINEFEKMGGNNYLMPVQSEDVNVSNGAILKSTGTTEFSETLMIPNTGEYSLFYRVNCPWAISNFKINDSFAVSNDSKWDAKIRIIENFTIIDDWSAINSQISLSEIYLKERKNSLNFTFNINQLKKQDHWIINTAPNVNLSIYNSIGFWIYPESETRYLSSEIFFHIKNAADEWYGISIFPKNNEWNYINLDISRWNRSNVNSIRFLVGDVWGTYEDNQKLNIFITGLKAFNCKNENLQWQIIPNVSIDSGYNTIQFGINIPDVCFDQIAMEHMNVKTRSVNIIAPQITFKKINPTKYNVLIENATEPFFLVFSESFHPQWKAYIEDDRTKDNDFNDIIAQYDNVKVKEARHEMTFSPKDVFYLLETPMDEKNHFTANGYANSWYIDPKEIDKDGDGNFTVTLYFKPQSYFYLGLAISITTLILCILYLLLDLRRNRKKTTKKAPKNTTPEYSEMAPFKDYVEHKKHGYIFNAQKKAERKHTASGLKEVNKKPEDIKNHRMLVKIR